jgi:hypothetical protein
MGVLASQIRAITKTVVNMPTPTLVDGQPQNWQPTSVDTTAAGFFVIAMGPQGGSMTDVTYFRGVPTMLENYSFLDPFGPGAATINFPQITIFDDLDAFGWLGTEDNPANVDIWWYEAAAGTDFRNPVTDAVSLTYGAGTRIWEGFVASRDLNGDESAGGLQIQCQGALFQLDYFKQKPFYPRRPFRLENLLFEISHPDYGPGNQGHWMGKPSLRTLPLLKRFPTGWTKITPPRGEGEPNLYTPVGFPNRLETGYSTRNTGNWDATLTGYFQDILAIMFTTDDCGVTPGNQWALRMEPNRQPVLEVRDRNRTPDFELWAGTPGVRIQVSEDYTQIENELYGEGTGVDGVTWRNAYVTGAWNRTEYEPLAAKAEVFPPPVDGVPNASYDANVMVHESKTQYPPGVDLEQAETSASKRLERVQDAGLMGTLSLRCDPSNMTKWQIKAGMTVLIKGIKGSGTTGVRFHIAEVVSRPQSNSVECKIDTKYRDLLTLEEARARNIDPLTPSKLLQVNKKSATIEDILAPWDYYAGSGYIPRYARHGKNRREGFNSRYNYFAGMAYTNRFPWESWTRNHPPSGYSIREDGFSRGPFVRVDANASASRNRWSLVPMLTAQKFTSRRIEVAAYDVNGNVLEIPFHVSIYYTRPSPVADFMPHEGTDYSPFREGAFQSYDETGVATPNDAPDASLVIGWGNFDQKAGHSPGLSSAGFPATGLLIDETSWGHDNSTPENPLWDEPAADAGEPQPAEAITLWCAFYAEHTSDVYFLGRVYNQPQTGS